MITYRSLVQKLAQNYLIGSLLAVLGVGGVLVFSTLQISSGEMAYLVVVLLVSIATMFTLEFLVFRKHIRPIRVLLEHSRPPFPHIHEAYLTAHQFPVLSVRRIFGPHLLGLSIPAILLTWLGLQLEWLTFPAYYIWLAFGGAILIASMHAMVEFFLTSSALRPVQEYSRSLAMQLYGEELSLEGRVIVSVRVKFMLSAFLIGTFPLFLFSLASQIRLSEAASELMADYWQWAIVILLISIGFSALGAWLLARDVQEPIGQLQSAMALVQQGKLNTAANDQYSDEFARLVAGFNHMVKGLQERDRMNSLLLESYFATLAAALDARDSYTAGHSQRVAGFSVMIGELSGMGTQQLDLLKKTALLHDIGKIGVRDDVLLKESRLTEEQFEQIKQHPVLGERILKQVEPSEAFEAYLPGVRSHHERYDGNGYPDGLAGEAIPPFGRIIAVADAFDAMTSDRPYRKGMELERALSILEEGKGTQWDPVYAELFIQAMRRNQAGPQREPAGSYG